MNHGSKETFEIAGESQVVAGKSSKPPAQGFRFGRIFHGIPPFRPTDASLRALGETMTATSIRGDSSIPAGYTYFGQFVDHDISRDETKGQPEEALPLVDDFEADAIRQGRSPSLDLDSLYGGSGVPDPRLLDPVGMKFRLGTTTPVPSFGVPADRAFPDFDVPRDPEAETKGLAVIGDHRNDENLIVQQLHLAFLKFHNRVVDELATPEKSPPLLFAEARQLVTRHYQWLVLNDFVRRLVAPATFSSVVGVLDLAGVAKVTLAPLVFKITGPQTPPMPLEFSVAAYRLGHSMVRDTYSWNRFFDRETPFKFFFVFTHLTGGIGKSGDDDDISFARGLPTFPSNWIADWRRMFPLEDVAGFPAFVRGDDEANREIPLNHAKLLDTQIAAELGRLPFKDGNLASRNLVRGSRNGLPSGQDIADAIVAGGDATAVALTPADLCLGLDPAALRVVREHEFDVKTPLWYYILKEAELGGGEHLGPVGSRLVVETFVALIRSSMTSIFNADPTQPGVLGVFDPTVNSTLRTPGGEPLTTLAHLLAFVGDINPLGDVQQPVAAVE